MLPPLQVSSIETGAESLSALVFHSFHLLLVTADAKGYVRVQNAADGSMLNTFHVTNGKPRAPGALGRLLKLPGSPLLPWLESQDFAGCHFDCQWLLDFHFLLHKTLVHLFASLALYSLTMNAPLLLLRHGNPWPRCTSRRPHCDAHGAGVPAAAE